MLLQKMKEQAKKYSTEIKQIDLDVNRTFRNHIMFMERFGVKYERYYMNSHTLKKVFIFIWLNVCLAC